MTQRTWTQSEIDNMLIEQHNKLKKEYYEAAKSFTLKSYVAGQIIQLNRIAIAIGSHVVYDIIQNSIDEILKEGLNYDR